MKFFIWLIRAAVFVILLALAAANTHDATLNLFAGYVWQAPLILIALAFFGVGLALGWLFALLAHFPRQLEIRRLKRELKQAQETALTVSRGEPPPLL